MLSALLEHLDLIPIPNEIGQLSKWDRIWDKNSVPIIFQDKTQDGGVSIPSREHL